MAKVSNVNRETGRRVTLTQEPGLTSLEVTSAPKASKTSAGGIEYVTDSLGRRIGLKKMGPSARYLLAEKIIATNMSTIMQLYTAASVVSIDDEGYPPLESKQDLLARLDEIGDEGLAAITEKVMLMYGGTMSEAEATTAKN